MIEECRGCGRRELHIVLDLGQQPLANHLVANASSPPEARFPLQLVFCPHCALLQVGETIDPETLYRRDYPYFSSTNPALLRHAREHCDYLKQRLSLGRDSLVVEVASNDGYLLRNFLGATEVLGIDPAVGPAQAAQQLGIPTINDFFSTRLAEQLVAEGRRAQLIIASNVAAHVDRINDFIRAFKILLAPEGTASFEVAYAVDMIDKCEFDTIYHEHLFYHSLIGFKTLLERNGLFMNAAEHIPIHGGSIRVYASHRPGATPKLEAWLTAERERGVGTLAFYDNFAAEVRKHTESLRELLRKLKREGAKIACWGAASKGATMLNYLGLGPGFFEWVVDISPQKQGKYMPGERLLIVPPERVIAERPDFILILVWNFAEDVIRSQRTYRERGGSFILPIPPRIVRGTD
jgi:C-methyltransferase-like protein/putative zinc binding protein/methyltransferase family protein